MSFPRSVFATINGHIYVDNGDNRKRIDMWTLETNQSISVMNVLGRCFGLFVDQNDSIYCSLYDRHQVIRATKDTLNQSIIIAGNGSLGSTSNMLDYPRGIFVDINFTLYVADHDNSRVQRFALGEVNGVTMVGKGSSQSIAMRCPTDVVLDGNGYLFVVVHCMHRIIGDGPDGYRCIVGCSNKEGSQPNRLSYPYQLSFDRDGNIYVSDWNNHRIQKFWLVRNNISGE